MYKRTTPEEKNTTLTITQKQVYDAKNISQTEY